VTRAALIVAVLTALAACGVTTPEGSDPVHPRQGPKVTEPGVTVSGSVRVGVVRVF
jgi:hypothetical protein